MNSISFAKNHATKVGNELYKQKVLVCICDVPTHIWTKFSCSSTYIFYAWLCRDSDMRASRNDLHT